QQDLPRRRSRGLQRRGQEDHLHRRQSPDADGGLALDALLGQRRAEGIWSDNGLCNLEDGCYAKLIDLNKQAEPVIAAALSKPGTLIENVPPLKGKQMSECHPDELDLTDKSITENTRFSYPLDANPNVMPGARGPHPETIVLLTADAFGVLPPVSILDSKQVMYHFVSGFTAKLAGTEVGVTEPKAAFSACFGAPFMAQKPSVYAK